jgi:hypothetical protein
MKTDFVTLKDILQKEPSFSYQKVTRAVAAMRDAALLVPWRGANNRICLTYDDAALLRRFIGFLRNGQTLGSAVEMLKRDMERDRIERLSQDMAGLQAENERLRALVEVRPISWWGRVIRWLSQPRERLIKVFHIATPSTIK